MGKTMNQKILIEMNENNCYLYLDAAEIGAIGTGVLDAAGECTR